MMDDIVNSPTKKKKKKEKNEKAKELLSVLKTAQVFLFVDYHEIWLSGRD